MKTALALLILLAAAPAATAEDGYELWLRYPPVADFSKRPIADGCGPPERTLEHFMSIDRRFVPGN